MSNLQTLANSMLAHAPALTLGIGAVVALGVITVIVMLAWPRKPIHDPVAEQRMAEAAEAGDSTGSGPHAARPSRVSGSSGEKQ